MFRGEGIADSRASRIGITSSLGDGDSRNGRAGGVGTARDGRSFVGEADVRREELLAAVAATRAAEGDDKVGAGEGGLSGEKLPGPREGRVGCIVGGGCTEG